MSEDDDNIVERIKEAAREGRVHFADPPKDAYLVPAFVEDFSRRILGMEWSDILFTSEESSVLDFDFEISHEDMVAKIKREYGVDCGDIKGLLLYQVMQRCADNGS
jgi:hypothetical protein